MNSQKREALKVNVLYQDRKISCLQACPCIFQPVNSTGWSSEGVKSRTASSFLFTDKMFFVTILEKPNAAPSADFIKATG